MASDLDYAKMIEIPLNTCKYQTKKGKSLFKKKKIISLINKKLKDEKPKDSHLSDNFNLNSNSFSVSKDSSFLGNKSFLVAVAL